MMKKLKMRKTAKQEILSGYRIMWMLVMFDLPTLTKEERKNAQKFRLGLLDLGYERAQLSVYMRMSTSLDHFSTLAKNIEALVPQGGIVDILQFSDKQYEKIISFHQSIRQKKRKNPDQLALF